MIRYLLMTTILTCAVGGARANLVDTYNFSGTLATGGTVTGQFMLDFTTASVTAFNFTTPLGTLDADTQLPSIEAFTPAAKPPLDFVAINFFGKGSVVPDLVLLFEADFDPSLFPGTFYTALIEGRIGLDESRLACGNCLPAFFSAFSAGSASLAPSSAPEPATLALLGIGLAGFGFSQRQRKQ